MSYFSGLNLMERNLFQAILVVRPESEEWRTTGFGCGFSTNNACSSPTDKGFAQHRQEAHHGMLIVRLRQPNEAKIHERVMRAMRQFPEANWPGLLVVVRDTIQSVSRAELN